LLGVWTVGGERKEVGVCSTNVVERKIEKMLKIWMKRGWEGKNKQG